MSEPTPREDSAEVSHKTSRATLVKGAVTNAANQHSKARQLLDASFTHMFKNLVYPQIWEDPEVDIEALDLKDGKRIVTIASGGCNVLNYLSAADIRVDAVDINVTHIALNRLKHASIRGLPTYEAFFRFFGYADERANHKAYKQFIRQYLDPQSRKYWEGRSWAGRRRISMFQRNFYHYGMLGRFIGLVHLLSRLHGKNPDRMLEARTREEQRWIFDNTLGLVFNSPLVKALCKMPVSLYGLGIPPNQYEELRSASSTGKMSDVLYERVERLACDYDIKDNYFAWQAFGRRYDTENRQAVPRYLRQENFSILKQRIDNVSVNYSNFGDYLAQQEDGSVDGFILLDAQDWMNDQQLNSLWAEINRTASVGARVIFRTAGVPSILPGRVADDIMDQWQYHAQESEDWHARDRSSIYGGFHAYEKTH